MAKVLFADDSLSVRLVALRFLTTAGYQVTLAADYSLSKRTDLYGTMSYGHASGSNGLGAAQAVISDAFVDGGKSTQELAIAGIRHRF